MLKKFSKAVAEFNYNQEVFKIVLNTAFWLCYTVSGRMPSRRAFDLSSLLCGIKSLKSQHTEKFPTEDKVLALNF